MLGASYFLLDPAERGNYAFAQLGPFQREVNIGFDESHLVACVEALALELVGEELALFRERKQGVRELDFPAGGRLRVFKNGKDIRGENIAPGNREPRRCLLGSRFFDELLHLDQVGAGRRAADDSVFGNFRCPHFHDADDGRAALAFVDIDQLAGAGNFGIDHVVAEQDGEALVLDRGTRAKNGMPETERLMLAQRDYVDGFRDRVTALQSRALMRKTNLVILIIEIIFGRRLAAAVDEDDVFDSLALRFVDDIFDNRAVDEG